MILQSSLAWRLAPAAQLRRRGVRVLVPYRYSLRHFPTRSHGLSQQPGKKTPFTPSSEQLEVVKLCSTQNVVVSARPGSGKTATAEAIVAAYPDKRVAILTYSKRLQLETYRRLCLYRNCDVFTFHAMAGLLFGVTVFDDKILLEQRKRALHYNEMPQWSLEPFDIIVLDEFQDCTELLFWVINCFILANERKRCGQPARLVVLGDERQTIYKFRGADDRYLTLSSTLLSPISPNPFAKVTLRQSFRLSDQTARFINHVFLGGESYITGSKPGPKPIVLRCNVWNTYTLADKLLSLIEDHGAKNSAILAPSIPKKGSLQRIVSNLAKKYRVPIAVSINDEVPLDDRVTEGKMCVSSIHQFKGSERDLIILFGMDSSFFRYFGREIPDDRCPNAVFVALTRAAKQLVLVYNENEKLMPFMSVEALYKTAEVINMTSNEQEIAPPNAPGRPLDFGLTLPRLNSVRDVTRSIRESLNKILERDLHVRQLSPPLPKEERIKIQNVVLSDQEKGFHEAVNDINGLVIVAAFEYEMNRTLSSLDLDQSSVEEISSIYPEQRISQLCRYACEYEAKLSGYFSRVIQMKTHNFDWIKPQDLAIAQRRLKEELGKRDGYLRFEVAVQAPFLIEDQKTLLQGRVDIVRYTNLNIGGKRKIESIWEIKFVPQLTNEHIIQACIYAYLLAIESGSLPRIILYNVRDGEKIGIVPQDGLHGLHRMIESVLRVRWTTLREMQHEEFIRMYADTMLEVLSLGR
ncbi:P-loop containing nucleoside triphosphate hydrolase protein [Hypoxylon argillaceum]|nr:P-loop containing nucleoside triphosphate hydrolase protein [Hypoxylon argillaceum]